MKAYVFARASGALILGSPYEHVAFGFETGTAGATSVRAVEVVSGKTSHAGDAMDFWLQSTTDPCTLMSSQVPFGVDTRYDMRKILEVPQPNVAAAATQVERPGLPHRLIR